MRYLKYLFDTQNTLKMIKKSHMDLMKKIKY